MEVAARGPLKMVVVVLAVWVAAVQWWLWCWRWLRSSVLLLASVLQQSLDTLFFSTWLHVVMMLVVLVVFLAFGSGLSDLAAFSGCIVLCCFAYADV